MTVQLRPHQQTAVDKMHNGCVLIGGVGVGKSLTALAYFVSKVCKGTYGDYGSMRTPKDIYIITTAKKRDSLDWDEEAIKFGISKDTENSISGIQLVVDSWNNIGKYTDVKDAFFILDEQRLVGSGAWTKAFYKIAKANEWVLLSATPGDTWLDYIPVFVANGFYKNRTEFKREHVIYASYTKFPKVERYISVGRLVRNKNSVLVDMPYDRHTVRHRKEITVDYDRELFDKVVKDRWHVYEERPLRDVSEMFSVMRKVVNSDASRISSIREILSKHPKVIVFYNFNYELEMLRTLGTAMSQDTSTTKRTDSSSRLSETTSSTKTPSSLSDCLPTPIDDEQGCPRSETKLPMLSGSDTMSGGCGSRMRRLSRESSSDLCGRWMEDQGSGESWTPCLEDLTLEQMLYLEESLRTGESNGISTPTCPCTPETIYKCRKKGCCLKESLRTNTLPSDSRPATSKLCGSCSSGHDHTTSSSTESCEIQSPGLGTSFAIAEWNGQKHEAIPTTDSWLYLVQYYAGAEGWNCIETDAIVFYSQTYSYKQFEQAHGRIDRMNTPFTDLYYYNFVSKSPIDLAIKKALRQKKSFNERDYGLV